MTGQEPEPCYLSVPEQLLSCRVLLKGRCGIAANTAYNVQGQREKIYQWYLRKKKESNKIFKEQEQIGSWTDRAVTAAASSVVSHLNTPELPENYPEKFHLLLWAKMSEAQRGKVTCPRAHWKWHRCGSTPAIKAVQANHWAYRFQFQLLAWL